MATNRHDMCSMQARYGICKSHICHALIELPFDHSLHGQFSQPLLELCPQVTLWNFSFFRNATWRFPQMKNTSSLSLPLFYLIKYGEFEIKPFLQVTQWTQRKVLKRLRCTLYYVDRWLDSNIFNWLILIQNVLFSLLYPFQ